MKKVLRLIPEDSQYRVLELLRDNPDMTQREMAEELGMTLGKTHYSLRALIQAGWVRAERFAQSDNKAGYLYVLTPDGIAERIKLAARLLAKKRAEYEALEAEISELEAKVKKSG